MLIWYTGHGENATGNWVFEDGCLAFEDIYDLYKKYFKDRYLYIVSDCCYSGSWVVECARLLDRDEISCGHAAKEHRVYIKVFASCLPNETACDKFYTECRGVRPYSSGGNLKVIAFAEHRELSCRGERDHQTTLGVDFSRTDLCILDKDRRRCHSMSWTKHVHLLCREESSRQYLV